MNEELAYSNMKEKINDLEDTLERKNSVIDKFDKMLKKLMKNIEQPL